MNKVISIFWFRQDLRLSDNAGLTEAANMGKVLPIYINDNTCPKEFEIGSASRTWLHHSLQNLQKSLKNNLNLYQGKPEEVIRELILRHGVTHVFWSDCYDKWGIEQQTLVITMLKKLGVLYKSYNSSYLWSPTAILKDDGSYYKVFGAYKRKAITIAPRNPISKPITLDLIKDKNNDTTIETFKFISQHSWQTKIMNGWRVGEEAAAHKLSGFITNKLCGYKKGRDYPGQNHTSGLSPHLRFGEISPHQIFDAIYSIGVFNAGEDDSEHFFSEMIWREFSCYLMYHFPALHKENFQSKFHRFPWKQNDVYLHAWQTGNTGYPIIDAGMRELWQTGYMHNRVRMIVASFLVKNLMIHWHFGRDWFWDCLIDADIANNSASWQWVAGCGVDAAPYFRVFNPITQGEKFDSTGEYTRRFVPELKSLPDRYLFKPWQAPEKILHSAGVVLGVNYPNPIIDLKISREAALLAYTRNIAGSRAVTSQYEELDEN
ncbi:cryptochrome/photolyase family protein [Candidatus Bandiella euplotis]|uniref:Deoxyribodipyrimidine photo-lyase n=1 Tax=Candidatus Bandiella euplotis TaxID=1664265 RepID=A0ABZ0UKP1_9RICK|nr:deoxyribodipyrimidine photo-lyase [Candidatus Bandiella woodruffii]WPX96289.1 Deoxyribodipyrimidine photo-lyase [Candidatus Bandiella woodruffii]